MVRQTHIVDEQIAQVIEHFQVNYESVLREKFLQTRPLSSKIILRIVF